MRSVALDLETTGLNPKEGHKIIEIGCVELINGFPSGKNWQKYINPQRNIPEEAFKVHGISEQFLSDKPIFSEIAEEFLRFINNSTLVIHNAVFDLNFINYELEAIGLAKIDNNSNNVIDTLTEAKKMFPGQSVSLDALCKRYKINIERKKHGALLDAELLGEVFLEMNGGRQQYIDLASNLIAKDNKKENKEIEYSKRIYFLTKEELEKHEKLIKFINNLKQVL